MKIGVSIVALVFFMLSTPHAVAFSSNQVPVIQISPSGGLAFDHAGNMWVADMQSSRVLGFMAPFTSGMTPSIVLGQPSFSSSWSSGWLANEMQYPTEVTFDQHGDLWVADTFNSRVIEFIPPFRNGMNASLVLGQKAAPASPYSGPLTDWSSTIPATSRNGLSSPDEIVFDSRGDLWAADSWNGRVLEFQPPFSNNMNASLVIGERGFVTSCNQGTRPLCGDSRTLNGPMTVAFDPAGNLWVTDTVYTVVYPVPVWQGRLLEFTPSFTNGMYASQVILEPRGTSGPAFDSTGNMWLARSDATSGNVSEYMPPFGASMKPAVVIQTNSSQGLVFDSAGNMWVESGNILGFNAQVHSVLGPTGRVYFRNQGGLLAPLLSIPSTMELAGTMSYPEGLFNFTIQGLPPGGSVKLAITFPDSLPPGVGWWSVVCYNNCREVQLHELPASQVQTGENKMTLKLTNASWEGVISLLGGPAVPPITSISVNAITTTSPSQSNVRPATSLILPILGGIVLVLAAVMVYRKRHFKHNRV